MNCFFRADAYLNSVTETVSSLCETILSNELQNSIEAQYRIAVTLVRLEQSTTDFIAETGLDSELPQLIVVIRHKFIDINEHLVRYLEKIQPQGYRFDELISTLKLETEILKEETRLS